MDNPFKNNMINWNTYQDKQLAVLVSLERSFNTSLNLSKAVEKNLTSMQSAMNAMVQAASSLSTYVSSLSSNRRSRGGSKGAFASMQKNLKELHEQEMKNSRTLYEQNMEYLENQLSAARKQLEVVLEAQETQRELDAKRKQSRDYLVQGTLNIIDKVGKAADNLSAASNTLIQTSGASGSAVRATRSEINAIISDLNKDTGFYYNNVEAYQKVVGIAGQAGIGSLDTLKEITRPILLADESMNVNISELTTLLGKWHTRYTFTSMDMEEMVDEIRGNTAGNNATAQAAIENLNKFQNFIGVYADNNEEIKNMSKAIFEESARLESVGINSGYIFDYMKQIGQGDYSNATTIMSLLQNSGTGIDWLGAQEMLRSGEVGDMKLVSDALARGAQAIGEQLADSAVTAEALKAYGLDIEEIYNILSASGALRTPDEFEKSVSGFASAAETIEDKYVSMTDKTHNIISSIFDKIASIQEKLGIGLSDIASILIVATGVYGTFKSLFTLSKGGSAGVAGTSMNILSGLRNIGMNSAIKGAITTPGALQGASQGLGKVATLGGGLGGTAMLAGGVTAGAALTVDGIKDITSDKTDKETKIYSGIEAAGGAAGAAALVALGVTNPIGWAALAVGGIALVAKSIHESANPVVGAAEMVAAEYEAAARDIRDKAHDQKSSLIEIQEGLSRNEDIEKMRTKLINTGILSEEDANTARTANKEALEKLTEAYLTATNQWSAEATNMLSKYGREDEDTVSAIMKKATASMQSWVDGFSSSWDISDEQLASADAFMYELYKDLQGRAANGEVFDDDTQKTYENLLDAYKDNKLTAKELNAIVDEGWGNTTFINSKFSAEAINKAAWQSQGVLNDGSGVLAANAMGNDYIVHGTDRATEVADTISLINTGKYSKAESIKMLDELKSKGYNSSEFSEIGEAAAKLGVTGYAVGTNYISHNQVAYLHEGEAVVPKKYNPAANMNELEILREQNKSRQERAANESRESQKYLKESVAVLSEIKEFLSYWREDNIKRDTATNHKNKYATNTLGIAKYMTVKA